MQDHLKPPLSVPGAAPGIEHDEIAYLPGGPGQATLICTDYGPEQVVVHEIADLSQFVDQHRPPWAAVRWICVDGLTDMRAIQALATKYDLHPLAVEDMLQRTQRTKVESYGGDESGMLARLFVVTHAVALVNNGLEHEQVSIFLDHKTVLTFQAGRSTEWEPIRQRIKTRGSRLRNSDASFLAYSLLDAIVDSCFPILEAFGDRAAELEDQILDRANPNLLHEIHRLKRDLLRLRWVIWPMREVIAYLQREIHECVSDTTRVYLRDLYDHVVQIIELIETYREISSDLTETYMSTVSNRMNEIMKVLTLIGTIFIPLTFLAGVYGMNFRHFPELDQVWAYPVFWLVCLVSAGVMLWLFRRRRWI